MRKTIILTLTILFLFCSPTYLSIPSRLYEQFLHKEYHVSTLGERAFTNGVIYQSSVYADTTKIDDKSYCNDSDLSLAWEVLTKKYPLDMGLQALHALRLGLCLKVERNDISLDDALEIFKEVKKTFVEKKVDELLKESSEQIKGP